MNDVKAKKGLISMRLLFGLLMLLVSVAIASALKLGWVQPYPDLKKAYFICVGFGVAGLIQAIIGSTELSRR